MYVELPEVDNEIEKGGESLLRKISDRIRRVYFRDIHRAVQMKSE